MNNMHLEVHMLAINSVLRWGVIVELESDEFICVAILVLFSKATA